MANARGSDEMVSKLLERYGRTWAEEAGIPLRNTPSPLFRLLCLSLLLSARISNEIAVRAAKALAREKWTSPARMIAATWEERTRALNRSGYARYDESTSRMLEDTSRHIIDRWAGDLRNLREEAERQPRREHQLLQTCKGIGPVGATIFCREAQVVWPELFPYVDDRAVAAARRLGLASTAAEVAERVAPDRLPRLVAALVRIDLDHGYASFVS